MILFSHQLSPNSWNSMLSMGKFRDSNFKIPLLNHQAMKNNNQNNQSNNNNLMVMKNRTNKRV